MPVPETVVEDEANETATIEVELFIPDSGGGGNEWTPRFVTRKRLIEVLTQMSNKGTLLDELAETPNKATALEEPAKSNANRIKDLAQRPNKATALEEVAKSSANRIKDLAQRAGKANLSGPPQVARKDPANEDN